MLILCDHWLFAVVTYNVKDFNQDTAMTYQIKSDIKIAPYITYSLTDLIIQ